MTKKKPRVKSLDEMEGDHRSQRGRPALDPRDRKKTKTQLKKRLWSKVETLNIIQDALTEVSPKSPVWDQLLKQYCQCRGFYAEPNQNQIGNNLTQVIAVRHFDSDEQFYAEAKKQQTKLMEKNKAVIAKMEEEREKESVED